MLESATTTAGWKVFFATLKKEKIYQMDTTKMTVEEVKKKKSGDTFSLTTIL